MGFSFEFTSQFTTEDFDVGWRFDAHPDNGIPHFEDGNGGVVTDDEAFMSLTGKYQHFAVLLSSSIDKLVLTGHEKPDMVPP